MPAQVWNRLIQVGGGAIALAATVILAPPGLANPLDARSLGMGRAQLAASDNPSMAWTTPALLGLPASHSVNMTLLPSLSVGVGNDVFGFGQLDQLLSGQSLSDADVQSVVNSIPAGGLGFKVDSGLTYGMSLPVIHTGFFARGLGETMGLNLPKDLVSFLFAGNANTTQVKVDSLQGTRIDALADGGVSFGLPIPLKGTKAAAIGVTARYIQAIGFAQVTQASGSLYQLNPDGSFSGKANLTYQYSYLGDQTNGTGMGTGQALDLSFATDVRDDLRLVANIGNLGYVHWPKIAEQTYNYTLNGLSLAQQPNGQYTFNPPSVNTPSTPGPNNGKEKWDALPVVYAVGTQWKPMKRLPWQVAGDVSVGSARGYGVSNQPELRVGTEFRPIPWLPLRGGLSMGGEKPTMFSFGLGVDLANSTVDFAFGSFNGLFAASKGAYYALSSQLKF